MIWRCVRVSVSVYMHTLQYEHEFRLHENTEKKQCYHIQN